LNRNCCHGNSNFFKEGLKERNVTREKRKEKKALENGQTAVND
jgi:hypothetical protein